jgi:Bacterial SH3 domain
MKKIMHENLNRQIMKHIVVYALLMLASPAFGQSSKSEFYRSYKAGSTLFVCASGGLNLREKPDLTGKALMRIGFGEMVTVLADTNPVVAITSESIEGEWVKVRWKGKDGYMFNGFLSRYAAMQSDGPSPQNLIAYLKKIFPLKSETTQPTDDRAYNVYQKITFQNGVEFLWEAPEGGSGVYVSFPLKEITFQEMYLLARAAYPEFFVPNVRCDYQEGDMDCTENAYGANLQLKKINEKYLMSWGHAD